jgi:signal transduction histidine kinase
VPTLSLGDPGDGPPQSADTFFLLVSPTGSVVSNPQGISLVDLPERQAVANALATGDDDWRTITANGVPVRLLTQRVDDGSGGVPAVLQSGFVLLLQEEQKNQLLATIVVACLAGLAGAALVTLLVTQRALRPIRTAFAAERRFVASASHELRTPVAVVRSSAEILQREELIKPEGQTLVDDIIAESDRLSRLVSDMLALASAEAGALTVEATEIEMRAFVQQVARRAEAMAAERGVRLEVVQDGEEHATDQELVVSADPDRMTQLLMIFIDNAIDHSPAGGTVRLFVRPAVDGGRPHVAVGVADEGPGVPREERARIFEPFARLRGRRRETGNTGLGLAIARILAARQHASLHVDDAAGGGAVFSVWLPRLLRKETTSA